jgi:hypothetical protein
MMVSRRIDFVAPPNSAGSSVTELDSEGNLIGNHSPAGARIDQPFGIELDSANNVWIGTVVGSFDAFLASHSFTSLHCAAVRA